ncbi:unnamed protein product [Arctia plantaginis]|uniref:Uncharacterized protein n=1 Tax=Arctia plantaginis TaxID=874455 RepID=A0A8S1A0P1_ARCPL|nr:unnamed protein product [Arctia plantaginis]
MMVFLLDSLFNGFFVIYIIDATLGTLYEKKSFLGLRDHRISNLLLNLDVSDCEDIDEDEEDEDLQVDMAGINENVVPRESESEWEESDEEFPMLPIHLVLLLLGELLIGLVMDAFR